MIVFIYGKNLFLLIMMCCIFNSEKEGVNLKKKKPLQWFRDIEN